MLQPPFNPTPKSNPYPANPRNRALIGVSNCLKLLLICFLLLVNGSEARTVAAVLKKLFVQIWVLFQVRSQRLSAFEAEQSPSLID
jgi:hypothetical protein